MRGLFSFLIFAIPLMSLASPATKSGYAIDTDKLCDGFPQISVGTLDTLCVGLIASKEDGLKMPRYATQGRDNIIYVTDMGGWAFNRGTVWAYYSSTQPDGRVQNNLVNLFPTKKLTMPNGIATDPEGRLYVGTPTGIIRFQPRDINTGKFIFDPEQEVIVNQFAQSIFRKDEYTSASAFNSMDAKYKNKHPLIQFTINKDFTEMYFNVGAPSNDCSRGLKTVDSQGKCIQSESPLASAAVWKVEFSKDSTRKVLKVEPYARGLRNSMALALHPQSNILLQGENGIDLPDEDRPYEEINLLEQGKHYGWPYCHSRGEVSPAFQGKIAASDCSKKFQVPLIFMPAHSAPLGMMYYQGTRLAPLKDKLIVGWHGYVKAGHRVVSYSVDQRGLPTSNKYEEVIFNWDPQAGVRPLGAPTGLTELNDGSILVLDDKNGALLRLSTGRNSDVKEDNKKGHSTEITESMIRSFEPLLPFVQKNCVMCHQSFAKGSTQEILEDMKNSMLNMASPTESKFYQKLKSKEMPPDFMRAQLKFTDEEFKAMEPLLEDFIRTLKP
ncbi:Glucose / Sorbosone dehydrogenase [compost metagenome]